MLVEQLRLLLPLGGELTFRQELVLECRRVLARFILPNFSFTKGKELSYISFVVEQNKLLRGYKDFIFFTASVE